MITITVTELHTQIAKIPRNPSTDLHGLLRTICANKAVNKTHSIASIAAYASGKTIGSLTGNAVTITVLFRVRTISWKCHKGINPIVKC